MKSTSGEILDCQVCHSKIADNSAHMELEGLKAVLQRLNNNMLNVKSITTDRHKQICSYLRKEQPEIEHQSSTLCSGLVYFPASVLKTFP